MPVPLSPLALSSLVSTLRSAGCVFAEDEADLIVATAAAPAELTAMVERRVAGHPWNTSSAGPSSAVCGSPWTPVSSSPAAAPSS